MNEGKMFLHLRDEARQSERRTPIVPSDVHPLIEAGWTIRVEASSKRVFSDSSYRDAGCEIVEPGSWMQPHPEAVILGLKELPKTPPALTNRMIHFAHIFKNQFGWGEEIERYRSGGGSLYDIEFLVDENGRRSAAFGYWAGWMGAALALWRHLARDQGQAGPGADLSSFDGREPIATQIGQLAETATTLPRCIVIGARGRSGTGAVAALEIAGCEVTQWDIEETRVLDRDTLLGHDLLVNCVLMTGPGLLLATPEDLSSPQSRITTISDVSCDPLSDYNPLPVYSAPTSWEEPFIRIGTNGSDNAIELTAIDNLPSLIPLESSEDFSRQFAPVLLRFDHSFQWQAAGRVFRETLARALEV
ncbi:MAG: saccharopine dehydrogenase [Pseudomonadota bacterium]